MKQKRIAVIAVIKIKKKTRVCLVTGRSSKNWIIPTGKHETKLSKRQVAALEAFEEAGVVGKIDSRFSTRVDSRSPGGKRKREIVLYRMTVKKVFKDWPEKNERRRKWAKPEELFRQLKDPKLAKCIRKHL